MTKQNETIGEILVNLFADLILWILIWGGAVTAWVSNDETFLGILLFLSGVAWVFREVYHKKRQNKTNSQRKKQTRSHKVNKK